MILNEVRGYFFMVIGCVFYALSTVLFLADNSIVAGGVTGLSTLIYLLTDGFTPIGVLTIAINVPIFLLGLKYTGWKFIIRSLLTVATLGVITDLLEFLPALTDDLVLASLYGGIC